MSQGGELLTVALGSTGALASIHFWNSIAANLPQCEASQKGTVQYDSSLFMERSNGTYLPRFLALDASQALSQEIPIVREMPLYGFSSCPERIDHSECKTKTDSESPSKAQPNQGPPMEEVPTSTSPQLWYQSIPFCLHARSVLSPCLPEDVLDNYSYGRALLSNSGTVGFDCPITGGGCQQAASTLSGTVRLWDTIEDILRWNFEACDAPQGIQFLGESTTLFGGLAETMMINVRDVFGAGITMMYHGMLTPQATGRQNTFDASLSDPSNLLVHDDRVKHHYNINRILSASLLNSAADLYFPLDSEILSDTFPTKDEDRSCSTFTEIIPAVLSTMVETSWHSCRSEQKFTHLRLRDTCSLLQYSSYTSTVMSYLGFPYPKQLPALPQTQDHRISSSVVSPEASLRWNSYLRFSSLLNKSLERDQNHEMILNSTPKSDTLTLPSSTTYAQIWSSRGIETTSSELQAHLNHDNFAYGTPRSLFWIDPSPIRLNPWTPTRFFLPEQSTRTAEVEKCLPSISTGVVHYLHVNSHYSHILHSYMTEGSNLHPSRYGESHIETDEWAEIRESMFVLMDEYDPNNRYETQEDSSD